MCSCPAVVTVVHVGVVIFIIIAGLTQSKASNFIQGGCGRSLNPTAWPDWTSPAAEDLARVLRSKGAENGSCQGCVTLVLLADPMHCRLTSCCSNLTYICYIPG